MNWSKVYGSIYILDWPSPPQNFSAKTYETSVSLSWDYSLNDSIVNELLHFTVYCSNVSSQANSISKVTLQTMNNTGSLGLLANALYTCCVLAVMTYGESQPVCINITTHGESQPVCTNIMTTVPSESYIHMTMFIESHDYNNVTD